ncbi:MAG: ribosome maturation factor RimP [Proteobacteria bacterium]|nr:ribosome maturation factor RimP [Pseudomonadota bacterium]
MKIAGLTEMIQPAVMALGFQFVGYEYLPQGRHSLLRLYIESENGITLDDCAKVSRQVSAVLDVEDPIQGNYTLEVSSPGLDRPLFTVQDYQRFIGHAVKVKMQLPVNGQKNFVGEVEAVEDKNIVLLVDAERVVLPFANISKGNLVPKF